MESWSVPQRILFDVSPSVTTGNHSGVREADAELFRYSVQLHTLRAKAANLAHVIISQFCVMVIASMWRHALRCIIGHVLGMRAKIEVCRIPAELIVSARAIVKHKQTVRDWPDVEFVRDAMRKNSIAIHADNSIVPVRGTLPEPAFTRGDSLFSESFSDGARIGELSMYAHSVMVMDKPSRLSVVYRCFLTATAMTISDLSGAWGNIVHVVSPPKTVERAGGIVAMPPGIYVS